MFSEYIPVGLIVVGVREAHFALLSNGARPAKGQHVRVAPSAGQVRAAAVDDALVVHCDVPPRDRHMLHHILLPQHSVQRMRLLPGRANCMHAQFTALSP